MKTFIKVCTLARQEVYKDFRAMPEKYDHSEKIAQLTIAKIEAYLDAVMRSHNVKKHLYNIIP